MISHSNLSKSAAEDEPPHGVGTTRARQPSIFAFLDFLHGAPATTAFVDEAFVMRSAMSGIVG
jgi:hypothetical protein